jgi:AcrR family transcriptional regulator
MASEAANAYAAGGEAAAAAPFPPLRDRSSRAQLRPRMLEAMLEASGEIGYEQVAVRHVIERARSSRATFYKYFQSKDDCFTQAYGEAGEWLYRRVVNVAGREPGWREGLRAGLAELLEFCANRPALARALFVEIHAADGQAREHRAELMRRFAAALDVAREELPDRTPPQVTGDFMVGAIENLISAKLMDGDAASVPDLLPGLLHFVVMQYCGEEAAWEEMTAAPLATWSARRAAAAAV